MDSLIKKKLAFVILGTILLITGIVFLVMSFKEGVSTKYLALALGFTFGANLCIVLANVLFRPKVKKD